MNKTITTSNKINIAVRDSKVYYEPIETTYEVVEKELSLTDLGFQLVNYEEEDFII